MRKFLDTTDAELMDLLQNGDHAAFNEIHSRYFAMLYDQALTMLGESDLAKDVVQDVFVVLWEQRTKLEIKRTLVGYLYGITRFHVLAKFRKGGYKERYVQHLQKNVELYSEPADQSILQRERLQELEAAITLLPSRMREILSLSREEHLSYRDIANLLGITENRVKNSISEAVKRLRAKLNTFLLFTV